MSALHWAFAAAARGTDVYLFLIGMMGIAAYAHINGIFDRVAALTVRIAGTSRIRLLALIYVAGIVTTAFFSNDATIVVLTPAVIDALRRYDCSPVPYVVACALIANAASFLLPISNPSNLLVFAGHMPALGAWLRVFALPSIAAIGVTFAVLVWFYRRELRGAVAPRNGTRTAGRANAGGCCCGAHRRGGGDRDDVGACRSARHGDVRLRGGDVRGNVRARSRGRAHDRA